MKKLIDLLTSKDLNSLENDAGANEESMA
jgi:hypothetical protein